MMDVAWIIRGKAESDLRFRDRFGTEVDLAGLLAYHLPAPNRRWKIRGQLFKKSGKKKPDLSVPLKLLVLEVQRKE